MAFRLRLCTHLGIVAPGGSAAPRWSAPRSRSLAEDRPSARSAPPCVAAARFPDARRGGLGLRTLHQGDSRLDHAYGLGLPVRLLAPIRAGGERDDHPAGTQPQLGRIHPGVEDLQPEIDQRASARRPVQLSSVASWKGGRSCTQDHQRAGPGPIVSMSSRPVINPFATNTWPSWKSP